LVAQSRGAFRDAVINLEKADYHFLSLMRTVNSRNSPNQEKKILLGGTKIATYNGPQAAI
jgi:PHD/YefM family antitoxin component YafN of YafNO toxin-antitoxin module